MIKSITRWVVTISWCIGSKNVPEFLYNIINWYKSLIIKLIYSFWVESIRGWIREISKFVRKMSVFILFKILSILDLKELIKLMEILFLKFIAGEISKIC